MICNKCGNKIDEGTMFCGNCGNKIELPETKAFHENPYGEKGSLNTKTFCGNCGSEMEIGAAFCGNCGASPYEEPTVDEELTVRIPREKLDSYEAESKVREYYRKSEPRSPEPRVVPRKKKSKAPVIILIVALVLILASGATFGYLWASGAFEEEEESSYSDRKSVKDDKKKLSDDEEEENKNKEEASEDEDEAKKEEEAEEAAEEESEYFFPSDEEYITDDDLDGLTKDEVAMIRNEIYARHGYMFKTEPFKSYFESQEWYVPNPNFNESMFSTIEKANKDFLVEYETERGWR